MVDGLGWGIDWIIALQASGGAVFTQAMDAFTFLGSELFYLLVMPALLWCFNASLGVRLGVALLTSASLNSILKLAFGLPRPYWADSRIRALTIETSYGLPSGHAQNPIVLWGYLAYRLQRWWATALAVVLILAISFSRVYLGVHFPADVVAGGLIGALLLVAFVRLEAPVTDWFARHALRVRLVAAGLGSFGLTVLGWIVAQATSGRVIPAEWIENVLGETGSDFNAQSPEGVISAGGAMFGFSLGAVLLADWGRFHAAGGMGPRLARFFVGLFGVLALHLGLSGLLPDGEPLRFLRYALVGFWIAYGAPRVFVALRLA